MSNTDPMEEFQLFLFDFDGLLVNSEEIHYRAYVMMLANRGFTLPWDFARYCRTAHYQAEAIANELYAQFPALKEQEPEWHKLYGEKKNIIMELIANGSVQLMPGVSELLSALEAMKAKSCVVTHSSYDLVSLLRRQHPILNTIPYWITRNDYTEPKPSPECYLKAIAHYAEDGERIIGFEDTPRGLNALIGTPAKPILICKVKYPEIPQFIARGVEHYPTLNDWMRRVSRYAAN